MVALARSTSGRSKASASEIQNAARTRLAPSTKKKFRLSPQKFQTETLPTHPRPADDVAADNAFHSIRWPASSSSATKNYRSISTALVPVLPQVCHQTSLLTPARDGHYGSHTA
jgi:hypothetical protein